MFWQQVGHHQANTERLCDNVLKYCTAGQATDEITAHAHCMLRTKLTVFHCNNRYTNAPQYYFIRTLPVGRVAQLV